MTYPEVRVCSPSSSTHRRVCEIELDVLRFVLSGVKHVHERRNGRVNHSVVSLVGNQLSLSPIATHFSICHCPAAFDTLNGFDFAHRRVLTKIIVIICCHSTGRPTGRARNGIDWPPCLRLSAGFRRVKVKGEGLCCRVFRQLDLYPYSQNVS